MKNKNFIHFIYKNFSCVDFYENLILDGSLNCTFVITDLNLLKQTTKIKKFYNRSFVPYPFGVFILYIAKLENLIAQIIIRIYVNIFNNLISVKRIESLLEKHGPNGIFVDQRFIPETKSNKKVSTLLNKLNIKKFSIPHAPHYRNSESIVTTNIDDIIYLSNTKIIQNENSGNIKYVGYPNFQNKSLKINFSKSSKKIILLLRYFDRIDNDLCDYSDDIVFLLSNMPKDYDLVINPHPSLDKKKLKIILKNCNIKKYTIADEIPEGNYLLCVATFTTVILNLVNHEIPLMMLNTDSFKSMLKWNFLNKLYKSLNGFCEDRESFLKNINDLNFFIDNYDTNHNLRILKNSFPRNSENNFLDIVS